MRYLEGDPSHGMMPRYREIEDDKNKYINVSQADSMMVTLGTANFDGVVICGPTGTGKTTIFRQFMRKATKLQLFGNVRFFEIFEESVSNSKDACSVLDAILKEKENCSVVLYLNVSKEDKIAYIADFCRKYLKFLKESYKLKELKMVLEFTVSDVELRERIIVTCKNFDIIDTDYIKDFEKKLQYFRVIAGNISREYDIKISNDMLMYTAICINSNYNNANNLTEYYNEYVKLFVTAKSMGLKSVTKKVVMKVNEDRFRRMKEMGFERLRETAFHESGHALFAFLQPRHWKLGYVLIIPGDTFAGVTYTNPIGDGSYAVYDKEYYIYQIAKSLAGRMAEELLKDKPNHHASATSDLTKAKEYAEVMVTKLGLQTSLGFNMTFDEKKPMSEAQRRGIEREVAQAIEEATFIAKREVHKHRGFIEKLANLLLKKYYVTADEARMLWEEHLMDLYKQNNS